MPLTDLGKNDVAKGILIGAGLALLVPLAVVTLAPLARPILRRAVKTGVMAYEKGREVLAELGETLEDATAEAQAELRAARMAGAAPAAADVDMEDDDVDLNDDDQGEEERA